MNEEALSALGAVGVFGSLDDQELYALAERATRRVVQKGEAVVRRGDRAGHVIVIADGRAIRFAAGDDGDDLGTGMGRGELIGANHALFGGAYGLTVVAETDCTVFSIERDVIEAVALRRSEVMRGLIDLARVGFRREILARVLPTIFGPLRPSMLDVLMRRATWVTLHRGDAPFRQGDVPDAWYVVASGRLRIVVTDALGNETVQAEIGPGESLGEVGLLSGIARTATPYAIRDSELIRFSASDFDEFVVQHSSALHELTRTITRRMFGERAEKPEVCRNIAVVPIGGAAVLCRELTARVVRELSRVGPTLFLDRERLPETFRSLRDAPSDHPAWLPFSAWIDDRAGEHRFIVFAADGASTPWTCRTLAEADEVLLVADANAVPSAGVIENELGRDDRHRARRTLVLLHAQGASLPRKTARWRDKVPVEHQQHVRVWREGDIARLVRTLAGTTTSLLLGAGGARGLAHVGTLRALREKSVEIDYVGGTSVGAIVAAMHAMGQSPSEMMHIARRFAKTRPFGDYALPVTSVLHGRRIEEMAQSLFGDTDIEDLWTPFFCTSCDISNFREVTFDRGRLAEAVLASSALPGVLPPRIIAGHIYVDGGTSDVLPAAVMRARCRGRIIAVDVSTERERFFPLEHYPTSWSALWMRMRHTAPVPLTLPELFMRAISFGVARRTEEVARSVELFLRPPVERFGTVEIDALDTIEGLGYDHARERLTAFIQP